MNDVAHAWFPWGLSPSDVEPDPLPEIEEHHGERRPAEREMFGAAARFLEGVARQRRFVSKFRTHR